MAIQANSEPKKDIVYIDADDEITVIIEKVRAAQQRIVALVLPKRATVLQSIVNMKLLKRSAENAQKQLVLITSEAGLLPLAGVVGLFVAGSLQTRPSIPLAPAALTTSEEVADDDFDTAAVEDQPVGQLAGLPTDDTETIELDNEDAAVPVAAAATGKPAKPSKGKDKKLKVPNFNRFRLVLIILALVLLLGIGGFIYGSTALAKATVTLKTDSSDVDTKASLTLDPKATVLDADSDTLPAKIASKQQTGSQQVSTTGQKNNGTKASGSVTLTNCNKDATAVTVPAGTGVSSGNATFITQSSVTLATSYFSGNSCKSVLDATKDVDVIAQTTGAAGNIAAASFSVAGYPTVTAKSSDAFTGGTDSIVKVVAQADIDSAKAKIASSDADSLKDQLTTQLSGSGYKPITGSLHAGDPVVTPSAAVGDQADTVNVTQATTYTMYGVKQSDLKQIITASVNKQIDTTKQQILKDGLDSAKYDVTAPASSGPLTLTLTATSLAGPDIQTGKLAAQLAGKQAGDVQTIVKTLPGVSDVDVKFSPFWIKKVPSDSAKVTIDVIKANE